MLDVRLSQVHTHTHSTRAIITQLKRVTFDACVQIRVCRAFNNPAYSCPHTCAHLRPARPLFVKRYMCNALTHTHTLASTERARTPLMHISERTLVINQYLVMSLHKSYAHTYMPPGRRIIQLHQCVRAYLATNLTPLAGWLALRCGARHHHPPDACSRISVDNKKLSVSQVPIYLWLCFRQSGGCLHNTHSAAAIAGFLADVAPECLMPGRHLAVRRTACIPANAHSRPAGAAVNVLDCRSQ